MKITTTMLLPPMLLASTAVTLTVSSASTSIFNTPSWSRLDDGIHCSPSGSRCRAMNEDTIPPDTHHRESCFTIGAFDSSIGGNYVLFLDRCGPLSHGHVSDPIMGQGPFCMNSSTGVVRDMKGAYCSFDKTIQSLRCRHNTPGEQHFQINIHRQPDGTSISFLSALSCLSPWHTALKWCQDHPASNRCPWLPWTLHPRTFLSDRGNALRDGLKWALNVSCLLFPEACSSFKVEDAINALSNIDFKVAVQALQDELGARCEPSRSISPSLCPYVPLIMEATLSAMEAVSDATTLVQAVLARVARKKLVQLAPSKPVPRAAQADFELSGQSTTKGSSQADPFDIIHWFRGILYDMCERKSYPWCQHVPDLLDFVEDMFKGTDNGHTTLGSPA
ncbi:hypothetical protein CSUB01_08243 [Colletotrichum sublineola]|uniref:Uncharacterized protein n=1 Tax=Colletotrichum sublineola TaxID=1173701 RepID=A0A066XKH3_COLSU|nr:hypothetical protein CSUB01_08243 [Colletotrichum sublineola]